LKNGDYWEGIEMTNKRRITFREIVEEARPAAAEAAWTRATLTSRLRHLVAAAGRQHAARRLSKLKSDAIRLAMSLAPNRIRVAIDSDYQVGLVSVRCLGRGMLHLPADAHLG
jgi:hypothetical protein